MPNVKILIAAVTSTLYDLGNPVCPASQIYLALGMDIDAYFKVADVLQQSGLAKVTSETIRLTDAGMSVGEKCSKILEASK